MVYLVQGNAQDLFRACGQEWMIVPSSDAHRMEQDMPQTRFLGTDAQAKYFIRTWEAEAQGSYYLPGNMSAGNLYWFMGEPLPLINRNEKPKDYQENYVHQYFAYVNEHQEPCGFMLMFRQDDPKRWVLGLVKNNHLAPEARTVVLLSSFDLTPYVKTTEGIVVSSTDPLKNPLMEQIDSPFLHSWLQKTIKADTGEMDPKAVRLAHLVRLMPVSDQVTAINFNEFRPDVVLAENPTLDLIAEYQLTLSPAMLKDCLSEHSGLRKEIEGTSLCDSEKINKNLLQMVILFYEEKILSANRDFLEKNVLAKTMTGTVWKDAQVQLIPFLVREAYSADLFQLILSEEAYYRSVRLLVQLGYTEDIREFFRNPDKCKELEYIDRLEDGNTKKLCLIFWAKSDLKLKDYKKIVEATIAYPLLAETLVALDQREIIPIKSLKKLVMDPFEHQQQSILYHFSAQLAQSGSIKADLKKLNVEELAELSKAFFVLKKTGIPAGNLYTWALKNNKQGQLLRLFLPHLDKVDNVSHREALINILYTGIQYGPVRQGRSIPVITDSALLVLAKNLHERFICAKQMQDLNFEKEIVALTADDRGIQGSRLRKIILRVEAQCKVVHERLRGSSADQDTIGQWQRAEKNYRRLLYCIAYDGLTQPNVDIHDRIKQAEREVLNIVDPEVRSILYKAFIVMANIVITALTLGIANDIKEKRTGNYWFFNQTPLGEQVRALDKEVMELIDLPRPASILTP
ncbi:hypothetical protein [Legionella maioricensis]|uniref:Uncharacterized protein n=1 Tax=Legionella maioricensis TaxID=2896528 RepID=A0A9X2IBW1_9GAMM|nr:hypothetical protein [Legionella maioricensis]MCL9683093.1 hypothetical protein [Legionella maioricensis]MCL9686441.1 hypothetical protein [Legionella maioricensis]